MSESCCGGGCCGPNESYKTDTDYSWEDRLSELRVRCGFGRMSYSVEPGLYRCGGPTEDSPVLVTANYKMSFDRVRRNLTGRDAWILVLDTKGVNVWCAAGKGTFGSDELVDRVTVTSLESVVSHRTLIVPQLGATGVSAHRVKALCGWNVRFGPIRAEDLPEFLDKGMKASEKMRKIDFPLADRLVLVPVDIKGHLKYLTSAVVVFYLLSGMTRGGYSTDSMLRYGSASAVLLVSALITGTVLTPALLPWIIPRSFALKGMLVWTVVLGSLTVLTGLVTGAGPDDATIYPLASILAWLMIGGAASSYLSMNFTGATTFTSLSGVKREMRFALPAQIVSAAAGIVLWIVLRFV